MIIEHLNEHQILTGASKNTNLGASILQNSYWPQAVHDMTNIVRIWTSMCTNNSAEDDLPKPEVQLTKCLICKLEECGICLVFGKLMRYYPLTVSAPLVTVVH